MKPLSLVPLLAMLSCSAPVEVAVSHFEASLVSCNGQSAPDRLALYVDFDVSNQGDEPIEVTRVTLRTDDPEIVVVSGAQDLAPAAAVGPDETTTFSCKDGFDVTTFPGENVTTSLQLVVDYRRGDETGTAYAVAGMDASIAWDNCQAFLGNPVPCHAE